MKHVAKENDQLWIYSMGKRFRVLAIFTSDEEANAHMERNPDAAVIACFGPFVVLASKYAIAEVHQSSYEQYVRERIGDSPACAKCGGTGVRTYPTTATWHGGAGGMTATSDVCNTCWGSGSTRPWPSHRMSQQSAGE